MGSTPLTTMSAVPVPTMSAVPVPSMSAVPVTTMTAAPITMASPVTTMRADPVTKAAPIVEPIPMTTLPTITAAPQMEYITAAPQVEDELANISKAVFDDQAMKTALPFAVYNRFKDALVTGAATSEEDMKEIAQAIFSWARARGAVSFT